VVKVQQLADDALQQLVGTTLLSSFFLLSFSFLLFFSSLLLLVANMK
jgi:hypothetical protein